MGLLGNAGLNAPLYVYVSRWFDRRRGSALALIASGQYISGALWPPIFEQRDRDLWLARRPCCGSACSRSLVIVPIAIVVLKRPPEVMRAAGRRDEGGAADRARLAAQPGVRAC